MRQINITLYTFDELAPEIQKRIIDSERWNVMEQCMYFYDFDYKATLQEAEKTFDIKVHNWEVSYCGYHYHTCITRNYAYRWGNDGIELPTLSGKLLDRYIHNNIMPYIQKGKYYGRLIGVHPDTRHIKRYSRIFKQLDCPLTGCCYDMYFLHPFLQYLEHPDNTTMYLDLMDQCVQSFFKSWYEEYRYWADDEDAIREELHNNQYEDRLYFADGTVCDVPLIRQKIA